MQTITLMKLLDQDLKLLLGEEVRVYANLYSIASIHIYGQNATLPTVSPYVVMVLKLKGTNTEEG